ncbi:MAG: UTP--glucose-1-phosphate uridylyltransferase [Clostridia bacterium]|nr:UTP--glucose-1-phosphate uridylyltransferase [Clostridia bacterium]
MMTVKKAIIPCAGFGTRFLPATKVVPKELFPIVDTPALSYIVEEAAKSGIEEVFIIISPQKQDVKRLFAPNEALNEQLESVGKTLELELANIDYGVKIHFGVQEKMNGNGMALMVARDFVGDEPFAVLFGDDVMYTGDGAPVTKQLIDAYEKTGGKTIVGCQCPPEEIARRCGVMIVGDVVDDKITEVRGIIEKPKAELPSKLVSLGRYVLTPDIFDALLKAPVKNGETYLTDAISLLANEPKNVYACEFEARRYDIGNKQGFLEAAIEFSLRREELREGVKAYLKSLKLD